MCILLKNVNKIYIIKTVTQLWLNKLNCLLQFKYLFLCYKDLRYVLFSPVGTLLSHFIPPAFFSIVETRAKPPAKGHTYANKVHFFRNAWCFLALYPLCTPPLNHPTTLYHAFTTPWPRGQLLLLLLHPRHRCKRHWHFFFCPFAHLLFSVLCCRCLMVFIHIF